MQYWFLYVLVHRSPIDNSWKRGRFHIGIRMRLLIDQSCSHYIREMLAAVRSEYLLFPSAVCKVGFTCHCVLPLMLPPFSKQYPKKDHRSCRRLSVYVKALSTATGLSMGISGWRGEASKDWRFADIRQQARFEISGLELSLPFRYMIWDRTSVFRL